MAAQQKQLNPILKLVLDIGPLVLSLPRTRSSAFLPPPEPSWWQYWLRLRFRMP
jgi:hypothetical protein